MAFTNKNIALAVAALVACGSAAATEDYDLRYAPGIGGADMSAPFEGGWVFQLPIYTYSGNIRSTTVSNNDLSAALSLPAGYVTSSTNIHTNTYISVHGFLPRLSYMSSTTFLGATVGGTVLLPLIQKGSGISVTGVDTTLGGLASGSLTDAQKAGLIATVNNTAKASANVLATGNSNKSAGFGDLEFSPILRWSTEATQTLFVLTAVAPTGKYSETLAANPSAGKFWTIRPALQFSYIGDGWDVGTRVAYSWNTRNTETKYKSGSYTNVDLTAMKSISESTRIGLSGYAVNQLTKDSAEMSDAECASRYGATECAIVQARQDATADKKGHVYGIGPEIAYIHGAGDYLLEGRMMKEFGSDTRPKGFTGFITLSKPF